MGSSRYSPEGLQPEEFPLDLRYRINALYKLALSSFHAGNYQDTLNYIERALDKFAQNDEMLTLLDMVKKKAPDLDYSFEKKYENKAPAAAAEPVGYQPTGGYTVPEKEEEETSNEEKPEVEEEPEEPQKEEMTAAEEKPEIVEKQEEPTSGDGPHQEPGTADSDKPAGVDQEQTEPAQQEGSDVKVLKPMARKIRKAPEKKPETQVSDIAQKTDYKPPKDVSGLFDFDSDNKEEPEEEGEKLSIVEQLRKRREEKKEPSELENQIKKQIEGFRSEGFVVTNIEQMAQDPNVEKKKVLDELMIFSAQVDQLKEYKDRVAKIENAKGINKPKLLAIKMKLNDPDKIPDIEKELVPLEEEVNAPELESYQISPEKQKEMEQLLQLGATALNQGNKVSARMFFESILKIDPNNKTAREGLEKL